jgi:hypothetical protein
VVARDLATGDILVAHIGCGRIAAGMKPKNCSQEDLQADDSFLGVERNTPIPSHGGPCESGLFFSVSDYYVEGCMEGGVRY